MLKSNHTFIYFYFPLCVVFLFVFCCCCFCLFVCFGVCLFFGLGGWVDGEGGREGLLSLGGNPSPTLAELNFYKQQASSRAALITPVCTKILSAGLPRRKSASLLPTNLLLQNHTRSHKLKAFFARPHLKKTSDTMVSQPSTSMGMLYHKQSRKQTP